MEWLKSMQQIARCPDLYSSFYRLSSKDAGFTFPIIKLNSVCCKTLLGECPVVQFGTPAFFNFVFPKTNARVEITLMTSPELLF